jgi:geranylgeranyl diphosphate synthase type I
MTVAARVDPQALLDSLAHSPCGTLLARELDDRWPDRADRLATITRYAVLPAGKLLRPLLTLHSAAAAGGRPEDIVPAALGVEYLHVATLAHDDIIDGDDVRRGRPSVPAAFGSTDALLCGDHLIFAAFGALASCRAGAPGAVTGAIEALAEAGADLCRGQLMEGGLSGDPAASTGSYLEMVRLKTGALFRAACQVGALLSGAGAAQVAGLAEYGEQLGIAFQIRDDLLAYSVPPEESGKPASSDLANGRATLPVLLAYQHSAPHDRDQLAEALRRGAGHPGAVAGLRSLLERAGALHRSREYLARHLHLARSALSSLGPTESVTVLSAIAQWAATGAADDAR